MTAVREVDELRMRVRRIGAARYLVLASGAALGASAVPIDGDPARLQVELARLIDIETGNAPARGTDPSAGLRRLGQSVHDVLFDDALVRCVRAARAAAEREGRGLRLRFDLPPVLQALPVEALCTPPEQPEQTFALDGTLSIARSLAGVAAGRRLPTGSEPPEVLRLLIATAAPRDLDLRRLDADAELAELAELPDFVVQTDIIRHATLSDLEKWLADNADAPAAVLLIAHGVCAPGREDSRIVLETSKGTADLVPADLLSGMLVRARRLRLVVLNLCFSARNSAREPFGGLAQALVGKGIPAVVGMHGLVTDRAAAVFGPKVFAGICANRPVDDAVTSARQHIASLPGHTAIEWATPTLFLHEGCRLGWLFKAREVRDDNASVDPLRDGEEAVKELEEDGNITPATALTAARYLRLSKQWRRTESIAKAVRPPTPAQRELIAEARAEQAWPGVERLCAALADGDPGAAEDLLGPARKLLPSAVVRVLTAEIAAARQADRLLGQAREAAGTGAWQSTVDILERAEREQLAGIRDVGTELATARQEVVLAGQYEHMLGHQEAGRWPAAHAEASAILAVREDGYRDTAIRARYFAARQAEAESRWPNAVDGYLACEGFSDSAARLPLVRGQVLAAAADWPGAEHQFRVAAELGAGGEQLARYAAARVAESSRRWEAARQLYAELPEVLSDVGARRGYADGMVADAREDWPGVLAGFGELPDEFADGEVGRRRQFARAKLAGERGDWRGVLTGLGATPDTGRDGSVGVLRWTARGRLAEESGDWARAAECYAATGGKQELDHRYAGARRDELNDGLPAALKAYRGMPAQYRDVGLRVGYLTAGAAAAEEDWARAVKLYAALPDDFEDTARKRDYAVLRAAATAERWAEAAEAAGPLGGYLDAAVAAAYARGRIAEDGEDWAAAIAAYESCPGHGDADSRAGYARGRELDAAGHWSAAKAEYARAAAGRDLRQRLARLDFLLAELSFAEGIAAASLAADPVTLRSLDFPYPALRSAGITAASPTEAVADATFVLMERGGISWHERMAWGQLRTPAKRLLVDVRMYPVREPAALAAALSALDATVADPLSWLRARLPADGPLLTLLAGDRAGAAAQWRERLARRPDRLPDVHCLGLVSFWHAQDLEENGAWEQTAPVWRTALACLAALLADDEFWARWRHDRALRYGHAVTPADTRQLRADFGRYTTDVLTGHADRHSAAGRETEAARYRELVSLLEAELDAAHCLREAGGLPVRGGGRLSCGPEYLRLTGLSEAFGEFIAAEHRRDSPGDARRGLLNRLRCAFSGLARASSLLERHRFEAALSALPDWHRSRRADLPGDCAGPARHGGVEGCPRCQEFLARDPAFAFLPERRFGLLRDAVGLAVRARLLIARDLLADGRADPALAELSDALGLAANGLIEVRTREAVLRIVTGRADALAAAGTGAAGLDEAIGLVERAAPVFAGTLAAELSGKLANLLADRGVRYGSGCLESGEPADPVRAVRELRRAFACDQDSDRVRYHLAQGLIRLSPAEPGFTGKLALVVEAVRCLHDGLARSDRLASAMKQALDALAELLLGRLPQGELHRLVQELGAAPAANLPGPDQARAHAAEAARHRAGGDLPRCAYRLAVAARADPGTAQYRADLLAVLAELTGEGGPEGD
ncbi:CHAT domain-containing protein [Amycolatopsis sp. NPDC004079]|uniref:CHAT domain-containing protein n=1 Tax=Amycolatopsis sp. NPDC004079 TaxID=3154549 RepID=UPI00339DEA4A